MTEKQDAAQAIPDETATSASAASGGTGAHAGASGGGTKRSSRKGSRSAGTTGKHAADGSAAAKENAGDAVKGTSTGTKASSKRSSKSSAAKSVEAARRSFYNPLPPEETASKSAAAKTPSSRSAGKKNATAEEAAAAAATTAAAGLEGTSREDELVAERAVPVDAPSALEAATASGAPAAASAGSTEAHSAAARPAAGTTAAADAVVPDDNTEEETADSIAERTVLATAASGAGAAAAARTAQGGPDAKRSRAEQAPASSLPQGAHTVFGNAIDEQLYQKMASNQAKLLSRIGEAATGGGTFRLTIEETPVLGARLDVRLLVPAAADTSAATGAEADEGAESAGQTLDGADASAEASASGPDIARDAQCVAKVRRTEARAQEAAATAAEAAATARAAARDVWLQRTAEASAESASAVARDARAMAEDAARSARVTLAPELPFAVAPAAKPLGKPLVIGVVGSDTGSVRRAIAVASAAHALGLVPYWFDPTAFEGAPCARLLQARREQTARDERTNGKLPAFLANRRRRRADDAAVLLPRAALDRENGRLTAPLFADVPADGPFVATHPLIAQAAIAAGFERVVNIVPDNRPMARNLAEGALHAAPTPSAALGCKMLRGMDKSRPLAPLPQDSVANVGHCIDHELVMGIPADCTARYTRMEQGAPVRYLVTLEDADALSDPLPSVLEQLARLARDGQAVLMVTVGTRRKAWDELVECIPLLHAAQEHFDEFAGVESFVAGGMTSAQLLGTRPEDGDLRDVGGALAGIHVFADSDERAALCAANVLMRVADVLVTRPNELAYYPIPKLLLPRVPGPDTWNARRSAEMGDGTYELSSTEEARAMIDALQDDRTLIADMCERIRQADKTRTYDGAYHIVQLAMGM